VTKPKKETKRSGRVQKQKAKKSKAFREFEVDRRSPSGKKELPY
jgi:hypothetical protein